MTFGTLIIIFLLAAILYNLVLIRKSLSKPKAQNLGIEFGPVTRK